MYVNERGYVDHEPLFQGLGPPEDEVLRFQAEDFAAMGDAGFASLEWDDLAPALAPCAIAALRSSSEGADCVWNVLKNKILASPEGETLLEMIVDTSCSSALSTLGLPSEAASIICALGGGVWRSVQNKASDELYRAAHARGSERSVAEGCGRTMVNAAGEVIGIECPGDPPTIEMPGDPCPGCGPSDDSAPDKPPVRFVSYPYSPLPVSFRPGAVAPPSGRIAGVVVDAAGLPVAGARVVIDGIPSITGANGAFLYGRVPGAYDITVRVGDVEVVRSGVVIEAGKTTDVGRIQIGGAPGDGNGGNGDDDSGYKEAGARVPWYRNKWTWIAAGTVIVGGVVAVAVLRRRS